MIMVIMRIDNDIDHCVIYGLGMFDLCINIFTYLAK